MQFPVPQFTEVEDKIIGPFTLKQFGIVFGAGIIIFLAYSATKSTAVIAVFGLLVGLPALGLAFAKPNGRPMYDSIGYMLRFLLGPKLMVFHKESVSSAKAAAIRSAEMASQAKQAEAQERPALQTTQQRLLEVNRILQQKAEEERGLVDKI